MVAIVTPFAGAKVDLALLRELVEWHIKSGTDAIVPVGTTGESPTLSHDEKADVIRTVVKTVKGRVPVIAGSGTNDTRTTIENTKMAKELGADAALVVAPYYNKPSQEGLFLHYEAVAKAVHIPICIYNVPSRSVVNILPATVARLAKIRNIVAIKEACGSLEQCAQIHNECDITVVSGDDSLTFPMMAQGATGVISVAANIIPKEMAELCAAAKKGDYKRARQVHLKYLTLMRTLFIEPSPVPVKTAMKWMGRGTGDVRLPLCGMTEASQAKLKDVLKAVELV